MDTNEKIKGLIKEYAEDLHKDTIEELKMKAAKTEETQAKILEENGELKSKLDALQGKSFTLNQNTGTNDYVFKGYNPDMSKNFKAVVSSAVREESAQLMYKALTSANTGNYAIPVTYGNALMGLAEIASVALRKCKVLRLNTPYLKLPKKGTRATVDAQAYGTANTSAATTLGQATFTVDKAVGAYEAVYANVFRTSNFDIMSEWVEPVMAESIGVKFDDYVFLSGGEFTSDIAGLTGVVTASGSANLAAALTYANLNALKWGVEVERGVNNAEWYMNRTTIGKTTALVDSYGRPLFQETPISNAPNGTLMGSPINICQSLVDASDADNVRIVYGDLSWYTIIINDDFFFVVDQLTQAKEKIVNFIMYSSADGNVMADGAFATMKRVDS